MLPTYYTPYIDPYTAAYCSYTLVNNMSTTLPTNFLK